MRYWNLLLFAVLIISCKKPNNPPTLTLKSGAAYTTSDIYATPGSQFTVGIDATAGSDDLKLLYTEVAFDGSNTAALQNQIWATGEQRQHFVQDLTITCRNQAGTERWIFNINDQDGRISKVEIRVTVQ